MPLWYSGAVEEHKAVRSSAGVFDISHMGRFNLQGAAAGEVLSRLFTRDSRQLDINGSIYCLACNQQGGIDDDVIIYRLADQRFIVICNASNQPTIAQRLNEGSEGSAVELTSLTDTVLLAVQGPDAVRQVEACLDISLSNVERRDCTQLSQNGDSYFLARTGYTGEDGFEVMTSAEAGRRLLERLVAAGVLPAGLAARDTLRLEAALPLHGHEITETTSPWEAGLGWTIDLDHDFIGRDAVAASEKQVRRRLACLVADDAGVMRAGCSVFNSGQKIGEVTSGGFSPMLNLSIALAYVPRELAREGNKLEVDVRGRRIACHTIKRPFYKFPAG